jgi:cell division transport system permease protein
VGRRAGGLALSTVGARRRSRLLRPAGFDDLGLRRAMSDRLLPFLVAAMAFLALLALAAAAAAAGLAQHWRQGAGATLTVQVPRPLDQAADAPGDSRQAAVLAALRATPGIAMARALTEDELTDLLRPWLGEGAAKLSLPLPGVIEVRLAGEDAVPPGLADRLAAIAPDVLVESHGIWLTRLAALARSLQACAALMLLVVVAVAVAVVAVATRAGLSARREAIGIVHGLGATDRYIAGRFAIRATLLAGSGGLAGGLAGLPLLLGLAQLAAPFTAAAAVTPAAGSGGALPPRLADVLAVLPPSLWIALPLLPLTAAGIGWITAQITVRRWLLRLR